MAELVYDETGRLLFTKEMKEEYTILCPTMIEIHFRLVLEVMKSFGYKVELLSTSSPNIAQEGLKYVHNDTCYPALLVIGQFIDALNSGKYDVNKVALIITQTGGGCRASNYIHLLRKALIRAGYPQVPVIFGHLGGTNWIEVIKFAKAHKNAYLDLSAAFASIATRMALIELPQRCLFSSDAPYGDPYLYRELVEFVSPSKEIADMALGDNIKELLHL